MSLCSKSSQFNALIAAACGLLLAGCASFSGDNAGGSSQTESLRAQPSLLLWQTIGGGVEGNLFTGHQRINFVRPVALAARGNFLYIVDAGQDLLYRYDLSISRLTVLKDLKGVVTGEVADIYVDRDLSFYLADTEGARVIHFDRDGNELQVFEDRRNLARPVAVSIDELSGQVLIADGFNDDVMVFNRLSQLQAAIGHRGIEEGEFMNITAMTPATDGIYVTTRLGHRIQLMDRNGAFIHAFEENTVVFPTSIVVDGNRAFVSDYIDNTIKVYLDGKLVDTFGGTGEGPGRFKRIADMWLDEGFLYVSDSMNGRIQILRVTADPSQKAIPR